ncbi:hypothetical protein DFH08DRAFT_827021 [Mycena albidolilacea]|uniref:Uncharacterized protein n=1 Tax=Mycena albidolilacea TaxID=1033008 RepID=A0AAD7E7L3_9AGAR|nr:hypothetical protein DFH08DRAFT_827021 [Mycena albidolilacea]
MIKTEGSLSPELQGLVVLGEADLVPEFGIGWSVVFEGGGSGEVRDCARHHRTEGVRNFGVFSAQSTKSFSHVAKGEEGGVRWTGGQRKNPEFWMADEGKRNIATRYSNSVAHSSQRAGQPTEDAGVLVKKTERASGGAGGGQMDCRDDHLGCERGGQKQTDEYGKAGDGQMVCRNDHLCCERGGQNQTDKYDLRKDQCGSKQVAQRCVRIKQEGSAGKTVQGEFIDGGKSKGNAEKISICCHQNFDWITGSSPNGSTISWHQWYQKNNKNPDPEWPKGAISGDFYSRKMHFLPRASGQRNTMWVYSLCRKVIGILIRYPNNVIFPTATCLAQCAQKPAVISSTLRAKTASLAPLKPPETSRQHSRCARSHHQPAMIFGRITRRLALLRREAASLGRWRLASAFGIRDRFLFISLLPYYYLDVDRFCTVFEVRKRDNGPQSLTTSRVRLRVLNRVSYHIPGTTED